MIEKGNASGDGVMDTSDETSNSHTSLSTTSLPTPSTVYSQQAKWALVGMVGMAGLFSPLPANIYFPAIPTLANVFGRSIEDINLTVTIYLAMHGASPMLWGPLSDRFGRRPLLLVCLAILVGSSLGLALCPPSAFWLLLLLRALQPFGCASTISLGAGVIGDIATVDERGGFFGMFNLGPMLAPCIGPALGGALSEHFGWRSIFWFLMIFSAACFAMILLFLPETMASARQQSLETAVDSDSTAKPEDRAKPKPSANPFRLLMYPDILLTLAYTGIVYAVNYTIMSTISSSFKVTYPFLSETMLGICYLSTGLGMILGSTITGKLLDREYARVKTKCETGEVSIEYARLRMSPFLLLGFVASGIGWGWCIKTKTSIAAPLVLQVILGYTSISILNSTMTLMIDIIRDQSSGIIACTNLVRCSLAALLVSLIDKATQELGHGWTYTLLGGLSALLLSCIYVEIKMGPRWRLAREKERGAQL
ncbi:major facilitator superfamily domain-containing protein [Cercophora newfieldiana]|uniref:Major facilitator superfamily domain-containing protein n=1 Tax=Cercophora newfieldiana TaxID=92897 RepID=A0AA40CKY8_9PEZI|nr:major facilitator superfamily domain-containing protein [Cercophora newfieldiana]